MSTLSLKGISGKKTKVAVYTGLNTVVKIGLKAFVGETPLATIDVDGSFAPAKTPRAKMTPEERKAAQKARPALTQAERVAKMELRLAKEKAKLA